MPKQWALDPHWEAEQACQQEVASHFREFPSKWTPVGLYRDRNCNVRIIDHFKIERRPGQTTVIDGDGKTLSKIVGNVEVGSNVSMASNVGLQELGPIDCVDCDKIRCPVTVLPRDSLCSFGEDINIDGRLKAWLREDDRESLETVINWTLPQSSLILSTNSAKVGGTPAPESGAWPSSTTRPLKVAASTIKGQFKNDADFAHEPSLWESDLIVVLSHIPIERCLVEGCECMWGMDGVTKEEDQFECSSCLESEFAPAEDHLPPPPCDTLHNLT